MGIGVKTKPAKKGALTNTPATPQQTKETNITERGKGTGNLATRLPRTNGTWDGQPGSGKWHSNNPEVKEITGGKPVVFKDGRPDFSSWSELDFTFKEGELNGTGRILIWYIIK